MGLGRIRFVVAIVALVFSSLASAQQAKFKHDGAFLDPRYPKSIRPKPLPKFGAIAGLPKRNDVLSVLQKQTEVRAQGSRGTCSIFSATALLESLMVSEFGASNSLNLSEEWLQYITHLNSTDEGSYSTANFRAIARHGMATEKSWPYVGASWKSIHDSPLAMDRCGDLKGQRLELCLVAHHNTDFMQMSLPELKAVDPQFLQIRVEADQMKIKYLASMKSQYVGIIADEAKIKKLLLQKIPLTLDLDFYYGAWNHSKAPELGLKRNMDHWVRGIVGYPEIGSKDRTVSNQMPAGHSIVLVGYDDDMEIEFEVQMADGSVQKTVRKGVYFFKNSWGTGSFGSQTIISGKNTPGYGMIIQDYAHDFGTFYQMLLNP